MMNIFKTPTPSPSLEEMIATPIFLVYKDEKTSLEIPQATIGTYNNRKYFIWKPAQEVHSALGQTYFFRPVDDFQLAKKENKFELTTSPSQIRDTRFSYISEDGLTHIKTARELIPRISTPENKHYKQFDETYQTAYPNFSQK